MGERVGAVRAASLWLPVLALPMIIAQLLLAFRPGAMLETSLWGAAASLIVAVVIVAWYVVGSLAAFMRLRQGWRTRRALQRFEATLGFGTRQTLAVSPDGMVLTQAPEARQNIGDWQGRSLAHFLAQDSAEPERLLQDLLQTARSRGLSCHPLEGGHTLELRDFGDGSLFVAELTATAEQDVPASMPLDLLPVPLIRISAEGDVRDFNDAARAYLPNLQRDVHLSSVLTGLGRPLDDWFREAAAAAHDLMPEVLRATSAENERFVQVHLCRDSAEPHDLFVHISDARALKTLEAQFVQSQKMQAVGQLAGGIAHDFNNLLTAITGHCDLLMLRHDQGDPDYADLDQITQNANRAANLVGQLLAFSRKQTLKPEVLDVRDTLSDLTHLLNRLVGERVTLEFEHGDSLRCVRADKGKLEQVVMNLVVNARDAMPEGGRIVIETCNELLSEQKTLGKFAIPAGDYVRIDVTDEGCGMSPTQLEQIFDPFYTTKKVGEGTGLGLSTVYGIIKQTGGYISVTSTPDLGTRFTIHLPAEAQGIKPSKPVTTNVAHAARPPSAAATILLVEDEAPVRAFAQRALTLKGYKVLPAASGEEALELLADATITPDLVISDVIMPGMDGLALVRDLLKRQPQLDVIFMSGYSEDIFQDGHKDFASAGFLQKPFSLTQLVETVQARLNAEPDQAADTVR